MASFLVLALMVAVQSPSTAPTPSAVTEAAPPVSAPVAPAPPAAPAAVPLLLVLDVGGDHLAAEERQSLTEALSLALARRLDLEVQSPRSLMDRVNFAEQQQQAGCDSSACMAEIANAMGARFVVFSRVVKLGDEQVLRADVYDNGVGRSVALTAVQGASANELLRRLPGLVDNLVAESGGQLPVRAAERRIELREDQPMSATMRSGLLVGGVGLGAGVLGGAVVTGTLLQRKSQLDARDAYVADPSIDNARAVVSSRPPFPDDTMTLATLGAGCVTAGGLLTLAIGGVIALVDGWSSSAAPSEDAR